MGTKKLFALIYTLSNFNMYQSAQLLLNYLGRPQPGFNLLEMEENTFLKNGEDNLTNAKDNRQIKGNKNLSYFDKLDNMMKEE